ncbi:hypothetical protein HG535_0F03670 [Zygotorulaspora mrakii]|uniref:SPX domain-containing protein n=1 Tax=Zygotorulaspora mrakii TaxID=42260 RepID=A0A7H9B6B7_ZYGMR|nr:uncharacterized protein HG535_0F03670 [Zygotorulaspora mrakii]QLG73856.1 hypothetical protein HG535_0F03670 [Zygotorulaspora mrakii]
MKFGDHINESAVPEWSDKYINYKLGKKKLKQYAKRLEEEANEEEFTLYGNASGPVFYNGTNDESAISDESELRQVNTQYGRQDKVYTSLQETFKTDFVTNWLIGSELAKCDEFYLWLLEKSRKKYSVLKEQLRIYHLHENHESFLDGEPIIAQQNGSSGSYGSIKNFPKNPKIMGFTRRLKKILSSNDLLPSWPTGLSNIKGNLKSSHTGTETFGGIAMAVTVHQAERMLSEALLEFYQYLQLVKTYRDLNVTGFRKMVKKFDKACHTSEVSEFMDYARDTSPLFKHVDANIQLLAQRMKQTGTAQASAKLKAINEDDDPIMWWETKITEWYTKDLTNSDSAQKRHNQRLKKLSIQYTLNEQMIHRNNRAIAQMFFSGIGLGTSGAFICYTLYLAFFSKFNSVLHQILFPLWSGWYMVLLAALLFLGNCFIWHRTGINYRFIMLGEMHAKNGTQLFNNDFATSAISLRLYFLTFFVIACSVCALMSFHWCVLEPYGLVYLGIVLFLFFCPNRVFPYFDKMVDSRIWLVKTAIRLMLSGLYPVEFGDFFLGDIICSLTYSMSDIAMFFCVCSSTPNSLCGSSKSKAFGVLSCLPNYWRMMQCFRRFGDSGDWFPHLLNAIKYLIGVGYYASLAAYRISGNIDSTRTPFIIISTTNAAITAAWDICIDWSLFQPSSKNWLLRDDLYLAGKRNWKTGQYAFGRVLFYYFAMVWDVLIRFQWIVYALAPQTIQQSAITSFVLAVTEILRRFVWVILRVENEHVANVHLFKVTGESPLPYPVSEKSDMVTADKRNVSSSSLSLYHGNLEEPSTAFKSYLRRNSSALFTLAKSVPWAHTTDFQRPRLFSFGANAVHDSESDSETESVN